MSAAFTAQKVLSYSGVGGLEEASVYQSRASASLRYPFCDDFQGWGPLSPYGDNLTPCFLDASISIFAISGALFGACALFYLFRKDVQKPLFRKWNFFAKLSILGVIVATTAVQAVLLIIQDPKIFIQDVRFWSLVTVLLSIIVIGAVQYVENWRSRVSNGVVLCYWLVFIIIYAVKSISLGPQMLNTVVTLHHMNLVLAVVEMSLEWLIPGFMRPKHVVGQGGENPRETADVFSEILFSWLTPFMEYGYRNIITEKELYRLRNWEAAGHTGSRFANAWAKEEARKKPSMLFAIVRAYGTEYIVSAIFEVLSDSLNLVQPIILQYFILWVASRGTENPSPYSWGITLAGLMFASSSLQTLAQQQSSQRTIETSSRVKAAVQVHLYQKSIKLSGAARGDKTVGDIVNRMSVDTQKVWMATRLVHMTWSAPVMLIVAMALLYRFLGWAMLAGFAVMILVTPFNGLVVVFNNKFEKQQMEAKDARTRLTTEIIDNMKSIKLYAWTNAYLSKLRDVRNNQELRAMRNESMVSSLFNLVWSMPKFLVAAASFIVYSYIQNKPLTSDIVFPALALFNMLSFPLGVFPMLMSIYVEANVSARRLRELFTAEELQPDAVIRKYRPEDSPNAEIVTVENASFSPSTTDNKVLVEIGQFSARVGELSCIIGQVGSGKSSFLSAILGNLYKTRGQVTVCGNVAYVPQTAWVMNASVKENIIFGRTFDSQLYDKTLQACALIHDLSTLPDGDKTEVGERGISLSGGQKARLSLARAVYAQADVYILDDCLSAVDEHVGKHLIEKVIGPRGMLSNSTRILATNSTRVLKSATSIYFMQEGRVTERGSYDELMSKDGSVKSLVNTLVEQQQKDDSGSGSKTPLITVTEADQSSSSTVTPPEEPSKTDISDALKKAAELAAVTIGGSAAKPSDAVVGAAEVTETFPLLTDIKADAVPKDPITAAEEGINPITNRKVETSEKGQVSWKVYIEYAKACRPWAIGLWALAMLAEQSLSLGSGLWIKHWSDLNDQHGGNYQPGKYIGIYTGIGVATSLFGVAESFICLTICGIAASASLHDRMAQAIFRAPMSFFETTPAGQVLNRFSSDMSKIDSGLVRSFVVVFTDLAYICFTLGVVTWTTPFFLILVIPMALVCRRLQQYYVRTSRELARLDSATKSPIFSHFQESIGGMASIRAYSREGDFARENESRIDANLRAFLCYTTTNRWVVMRLELMASVVVGGSAVLTVAAISAGYNTSAGAVGLAMSFALQIANALSMLVRMTVDIENSLVSVERVLEYTNLPSEAADVVLEQRPQQDWPQNGAVEFKDYSARYRPGLPLVLDNINLFIKPGERIGIVGRTGAGKSTLTLSLFRLIEPAAGHVAIDDVNTSNLGLYDLRSRLAIIPQDASIIQGSIRTNLDPGSKHSDEDLWRALEHSQLKPHITAMDGGLDAKLQEGGSNLSQGQRQLVSLARALLTSSKVLVLDEATSAVDHATDALLQGTLRGEIFKGRTIVTIAHRINTVVDSDRIVVLEKGSVMEFDTPAELVKRGGLFRELVAEAGLLGRFEGG